MFRGRFESSLPFRPRLFELNDEFFSRWLAPVSFPLTVIPRSATEPPQLIVGHFSQSVSQPFAIDSPVARQVRPLVHGCDRHLCKIHHSENRKIADDGST